MALYNERGNIRVTESDTSMPFGIYTADGSLRVTVVDGTTVTGLYAADGSFNVVEVLSTDLPVSLYHPCGALRAHATTGSETGVRAPNGALYVDGLDTAPPVLTLIEDGLEEATPFYSFSSSHIAELTWDFHSSATPPAEGAGDIATGTQAIPSGITVWDIDLSAYAGETGYIHFRATNGAGASNILTSQVITIPGLGPTDGLLQEDGTSFYLQEDGTSYLTQESA